MSENYFTDEQVDQAVAAELIEDLQEAWQDKAAKQVPEAAHLKRHWHGNTKQEVLDQAKAMAEDLKEAAPSPSVTGGSPSLDAYHPGDPEQETAELQRRIQRGDEAAFSEWLRGKYHSADMPYVDE